MLVNAHNSVTVAGYTLTVGERMHLPTLTGPPANPYLHRLPNGVLVTHSHACDFESFQSTTGGQTWANLPWGIGCSVVNCCDGGVFAMDFRTYPAEGDTPGVFDARGRWVLPDYNNPGNPLHVKAHIPGAIPTIDDTGRYGGGPAFWRSIVEFDDGTLLASGYGNFEDNDATPFGYPAEWGMRRFVSFVTESHDRGRTWHLRSIMASDRSTGQEGFCEPVMIHLGGGELLAVIRTGRSSPLYQVRSLDYGYTWSQPASLHVPGVDPSLIQLADGTVVLGWGTRIPDAPWDKANIDDYQTRYVEGQGDPPLVRGGYIALSRDGGRTYSAPVMLDNGVGQSYTALVETTPGEILFAIRHNWRKYTPGDWLTGDGRTYIYPVSFKPAIP